MVSLRSSQLSRVLDPASEVEALWPGRACCEAGKEVGIWGEAGKTDKASPGRQGLSSHVTRATGSFEQGHAVI